MHLVGGHTERSSCPTPLKWTGMSLTRSGFLGPLQVWPWVFPGMLPPPSLWAACSSISLPHCKEFPPNTRSKSTLLPFSHCPLSYHWNAFVNSPLQILKCCHKFLKYSVKSVCKPNGSTSCWELLHMLCRSHLYWLIRVPLVSCVTNFYKQCLPSHLAQNRFVLTTSDVWVATLAVVKISNKLKKNHVCGQDHCSHVPCEEVLFVLSFFILVFNVCGLTEVIFIYWCYFQDLIHVLESAFYLDPF